MPRRKTRRKTRRKRRRRSVIPGPVKKGIRDINRVTRRVARGIDRYPMAALRAIGKQVLKPRKFPGLSGGFMSKAVRQLRNPGVYGVVKTAKKGGRKRSRGGKKKKRPWGWSDVALGAFAAPIEVGRLALGKGGRRTRKGGRRHH